MASEEDKVITAGKSGTFDVSPESADAKSTPAPFKFNFGESQSAGIDLGKLKLADNIGSDDDDDEDDEDDEDFEEEEDEDGALQAVMDEMPPEVLARVLKLKGLDVERSELVTQYETERCALEAKYRKLYEPLFATRAEVVSGRLAVPLPEELSHHKSSAEDSKLGVPKFWLQAMARRGVLAEVIEETDIEALGFLEDIKCTDNDKMDGFTLEFFFAENPYFDNKCLTKTYEVGTLLSSEEPILEKVLGTEIQWKKGQNLAFEEKQKKQRAKKGKNKGTVRYVTEKTKRPSFFHFFESLDVTKLSAEELDQAEAEDMMERFNLDYTAASLLRTEVIPQAVLCYTGELQDSEDEDDFDFDEEGEDSDDSEEEVARGKRGGKKGGKGNKASGKGNGGKGKGGKSPFAPQGAGGDEANPECKQS